MNNHVIECKALTVFYGKNRGIVDVDLAIEKGEVFGFLGPNAAGKTTTQRVLMDVIRPNSGQAYIFGENCQKEGAEIRKRVGYLPGELSLYPGMLGRNFLNMLASLKDRPLEANYLDSLFERFDLDPGRKMKEYSSGNKQKIGIIAAFMSRPELLILDEPTSGLDPLIQQEVLELVRESKADGRTVFFSSHILPEVQAVCDRVGIIRQGSVIKTERVETLTKKQFLRLKLSLGKVAPAKAFDFKGVTEVGRKDGEVKLEIRENLQKVMEAAIPLGISDIETLPVTLEEIFLEFYDRKKNGGLQ